MGQHESTRYTKRHTLPNYPGRCNFVSRRRAYRGTAMTEERPKSFKYDLPRCVDYLKILYVYNCFIYCIFLAQSVKFLFIVTYILLLCLSILLCFCTPSISLSLIYLSTHCVVARLVTRINLYTCTVAEGKEFLRGATWRANSFCRGRMCRVIYGN